MRVTIKRSTLMQAVKKRLKERQTPVGQNTPQMQRTQDKNKEWIDKSTKDIVNKYSDINDRVNYNQYAQGRLLKPIQLQIIRDKTQETLGFFPTTQQIVAAIQSVDVTNRIIKMIAWDKKQGYKI